MTIRLTKTESSTHVTPDSARVVYRVTVEFKTEADANDIARAFELVLAPRFTRDEAIAIVRGSVDPDTVDPSKRAAFSAGVRHALEALAAAGAFVDGRNMADRLDAAGIR